MRSFAIVVSRFNEIVCKRLVEGALQAFSQAKIQTENIHTFWVPGAFEIPSAAKKLADTKKFAGIVCLGAVIRGETPHFDYICQTVAHGIAELARQSGMPLIFGVLTCDTMEQAMQRSGGAHGNKGFEAAQAALQMAELFKQIDTTA